MTQSEFDIYQNNVSRSTTAREERGSVCLGVEGRLKGKGERGGGRSARAYPFKPY